MKILPLSLQSLSEIYDNNAIYVDKTEYVIVFNYLGLAMRSEPHSSKGRADVVVQMITHIYIFEFKINKSAEEAFQQIIDLEYAEKYRASDKPILAIGVNFNTQNRKMDPWKQDFL